MIKMEALYEGKAALNENRLKRRGGMRVLPQGSGENPVGG
jgi:hypothetical protein